MSNANDSAGGNPARGVDSQTPLLGSYDRREPPCGMGDACGHGTFTPRMEIDGPAWRTADFVGERSRIRHLSRQSTGAAPSIHGPENLPQTGTSTPLPVRHSKSL